MENASSRDPEDVIDLNSDITIRLVIVNHTKQDIISAGFDLKTIKGETLFGTGGKFECTPEQPTELVCRIPGKFLNNDLYQVTPYFHTEAMSPLCNLPEFLTFEIKDTARDNNYLGKVNGFIRTKFEWEKRSVKI